MYLENTKQVTIDIAIENVVATTGIGHEINLEKIIRKFSDVKYNPKKFPGAIIKLKSPRATIILFRTGSIVCTGTKSEEMAKKSLIFFAAKLEKYGVELVHGLSKIKIENIASSCNLKSKIHLEDAARVLPRSLYEPEQFPGIIHRMSYPKTVILLFATGKLICTGAKITTDVYTSINTLRYMLEEKNLIGLCEK